MERDIYDLITNTWDAGEDHLFMNKQLMDHVMFEIDQLYKHKISMATNARDLQLWAECESSKLRMIWVYFIRLAKKSKWSSRMQIVRLKDHYTSPEN